MSLHSRIRRDMAVAMIFWAGSASAKPGDDGTRELDREEVEAWLDSQAIITDLGPNEAPPEAPALPPRKRGFVAETAIGALGHVGAMRNISPVAPWFHFQFGYEVFDWAMLFAETDFAFSDTRYARRPPAPRSYALFGVGGGVRFTVRPAHWLGLYLQGDAGTAAITEDVLRTYGFAEADELNPYFGALFGVEAYQVSPRTALALIGGVRNYPSAFDQTGSSRSTLTWIGALGLRHAF